MEIAIAQKDPRDNLRLSKLLQGWELEGVIKIVGFVTNSEQLIVKAMQTRPQLIISDIEGANSIQAFARIKKSCPDLKILIYSSNSSLEEYLGVIDGYCHPENSEQLLTALAVLTSGAMYWDGHLKGIICQARGVREQIKLSAIEEEILKMLAEGLIYKEIALRLSLSVESIKSYVAKLRNKFLVKNREQLLLKALSYGLISQE